VIFHQSRLPVGVSGGLLVSQPGGGAQVVWDSLPDLPPNVEIR
jgi:hypothetical protein